MTAALQGLQASVQSCKLQEDGSPNLDTLAASLLCIGSRLACWRAGACTLPVPHFFVEA